MSVDFAPYQDAATTDQAFSTHLGRGPVDYMHALGTAIHYGQRQGARVQDAFTGKWYWDCHRNGSLYNLGHRNPAIVATLSQALQQLEVGNLFLASGQKAFAAERLVDSSSGMLPGVTFAASGAEASEIAIRAVRGFTRRKNLVSLEGSYHGSTCFAMAAGGNKEFRQRYLLDFDEITFVPYNNMAAMRAAVDQDTAAVLLEASPAQLGFPEPDPGYFQAVAAICRNAGAQLIVDEVQTGLGGTGSFWFWQQQGVVPDVVTIAKGLGGGLLANAAVLLAPPIKEWFHDSLYPHSSTFAGNELACVITSKVCEMIMAEGFLDHVRALAEQFKQGFCGAPFKVNQNGLCMGLISNGEDNVTMTRKLFEAGVLAIPAKYDSRAIEFRPILVLSQEEANQIISIVRDTLG